MGRMQADDMATRLPQEQALEWHLQYNHYPPVNLVFIPVAKEAIDRANNSDWSHVIKMPNGKELTVASIVEGLHLESFLEQDESEE